jgi:putative transposase
MTNYRRYRLKGGCYFFTVALAERQGSLLVEHIQALRAAFLATKRARSF